MTRIRLVDALWAVLCGAVRSRTIVVALSCASCPLWACLAHADADVDTVAVPRANHLSSAVTCVLPGWDNGALALLRDLSAQLGSIVLPGLSPDATSQLWMGVPLTMRAFALPIVDAAVNRSVVARLSQAQPILRDLAITNDGLMLVGRDRDAQWAAYWQIVDGWARGWLSVIALHLPENRAEMDSGIRSKAPPWLPIDAHMIAHYLTDAHAKGSQSQGIWQIKRPAKQAAHTVAKGLVRDGWMSQSSMGDRWRRGPCVLDFRVFDSGSIATARVMGSGPDVIPAAHSLLWVLLRQVPT